MVHCLTIEDFSLLLLLASEIICIHMKASPNTCKIYRRDNQQFLGILDLHKIAFCKHIMNHGASYTNVSSLTGVFSLAVPRSQAKETSDLYAKDRMYVRSNLQRFARETCDQLQHTSTY